MGIIFLLFAGFQWNDPDPIEWIAIYVAVSTVHFLAFFGIFKRIPVFALMVILFTWALFYIPGVMDWLGNHEIGDIAKSMRAEEPYIEFSREFLGLVLCILSLVLQVMRDNKKT